MRSYIIAAALAATAMATTPTQAQTVVCKQDSGGRLAATVVGAGIGAILGRVITGRHGGTTGAIVGGVVGGVGANQLAKSDQDNCSRAYGYYDDQGRWHANRIGRGEAVGYYDRSGAWVQGAPNGYYDGDRWVALSGDAEASGYYDRDGRWVPVAASGYYAADDQWVPVSAPGYYDRSGRWIAGPVNGRYDSTGRWTTDSNTTYRPAGNGWVAASQPGYYDANGRWHAGQVTGYYDARGRWVSMGGATNAAYDDRRDVRARVDRIGTRIDRNRERGLISSREATSARRELAQIRSSADRLRRSDGTYSARDEAYLQQRLDRLSTTVRADREDGDSRPS
ncbi:hypothetical protein [Sphingomonas crocodyli]|nr:hypothetical protein [Sphingomonas crocodyli]